MLAQREKSYEDFSARTVLKTLSVVYMMQDHVRTNAPKQRYTTDVNLAKKRFLNLSGVCSFKDKDIHFGRFLAVSTGFIMLRLN